LCYRSLRVNDLVPRGSLNFFSGTGRFSGANGEGNFDETLTFVDPSLDLLGAGIENWNLHLQ